MVPAWTVTVSYLAYAAMLAIGAACWLASLFDTIVYNRVEMGRLDQRWLDLSTMLMRRADLAVWASLACAVVAFGLAVLPAGDAASVARAHKAYLLRYGAVAICFVAVMSLARVRMGGFDADIGSVILFAWSLWIVVAGWRAYAGEAAIAGPAGWWLAAIVDLLLVALFGFFWIMIKIEGFRMF
ncbi:MAG: hypothetical protein ACFB13_19840 [Kiloniellaceae bacterium]